MGTTFKITQRHYDIILKQAFANYPEECGGFVGGKDFLISAIFPVFNQHLYNKTDTFSLTTDDIIRAHQFFEKHKLDYYGIYHTHPKGIAEPSKQDLKHLQKYLFIISLRDQNNPDFAAFEVVGQQQAVRVPLTITTQQIDVVDIHNHGRTKQSLNVNEIGGHNEEKEKLEMRMSEMVQGKVKYTKMKPKDDKQDSSGFSTLA